MKNLITNKKGSYTIEVSMIFTVIILAVLAMMFTFAYMLQKVSLLKSAVSAAQQGAEVWTDSRKSIGNGMVDTGEMRDSLYFRVKDNLLFQEKIFKWSTDGTNESNDYKSLPGKKVSKLTNSICNALKGGILKPRATDIYISCSNNLFKGRIAVEINQEVSPPLGGIKAFLDGKDTVTMQGRAVSTIVEPSEYIRNIDLAVELSKRVEDELNFQDILEQISGEKRKQ
jgi:hypothetical protein